MSERHRPLVIAHRGASADYPENTVAAFLGAAEQGADWVELDVRPTAEGDLVVHHNPTYDDGRTVWEVGRDERPSGVCTLAAALDACAGMGVNVEIKNSPGDLGGERGAPHSLDVVDAVVALLAERQVGGAGDRILVSSFDGPTLARVRVLDPALATAALVFDMNLTPVAPEDAAAAGHGALNPWDPFVDAGLVERCRALGIAVHPWTVDDPDRITELARLRVDGVITNVPGLALEVLTG
jgi:glycerophosphoryl diester phosphodiesterase